MSIDSSSLIEKVRQWTEREGYPLEMRLRKRFSDRGFGLAQPAFLDEETSKSRAGADIAAYRHEVENLTRGRQRRAYVFAVVECKLGGSRRWIAFMHPHSGHGINMVQQLTCTSSDRELVARLTRPERRRTLQPRLEERRILIAPERVAYVIAEFEGPRDRSLPYDAIRQVLDSSIGVVSEHKR